MPSWVILSVSMPKAPDPHPYPRLSRPSSATKLWGILRVALRVVKGLFLAYAVAFSIAGTLLLALGAYKAYKLYDSVAGLADRWPEKTSLMEIREKQWKDSGITVQTRWKPVPLSRISENLRKTVLVGEDDKFYSHNGFDMDAIQSALAEAKVKGKVKRGASTITQQLAKNLYLSPGKSFVRKAEEALYTLALEHFLTKDRILELYLNVIEWGKGVYGAEAAAQTFFGVSAAQLDLDQAARLAAVLPKPLKVSPVGVNGFMLNRRAAILANLHKYRGVPPPVDSAKADDLDDEAALDDEPATISASDSVVVAVPAVIDSTPAAPPDTTKR